MVSKPYNILVFGQDYFTQAFFQGLLSHQQEINYLVCLSTREGKIKSPAKDLSKYLRQENILKLTYHSSFIGLHNTLRLSEHYGGFDIGVVASFAQNIFIPPKIKNYFNIGIYNLHPSLLPKYPHKCCNSVISNTIVNQEKDTGVTISDLSKSELLTNGEYLFQSSSQIMDHNNITFTSLANNLGQLGADSLFQMIENIIKSDPLSIPNGQANKYPEKSSDFCNINIHIYIYIIGGPAISPGEISAEEVLRRIRAFDQNSNDPCHIYVNIFGEWQIIELLDGKLVNANSDLVWEKEYLSQIDEDIVLRGHLWAPISNYRNPNISDIQKEEEGIYLRCEDQWIKLSKVRLRTNIRDEKGNIQKKTSKIMGHMRLRQVYMKNMFWKRTYKKSHFNTATNSQIDQILENYRITPLVHQTFI